MIEIELIIKESLIYILIEVLLFLLIFVILGNIVDMIKIM